MRENRDRACEIEKRGIQRCERQKREGYSEGDIKEIDTMREG